MIGYDSRRYNDNATWIFRGFEEVGPPCRVAHSIKPCPIFSLQWVELPLWRSSPLLAPPWDAKADDWKLMKLQYVSSPTPPLSTHAYCHTGFAETDFAVKSPLAVFNYQQLYLGLSIIFISTGLIVTTFAWFDWTLKHTQFVTTTSGKAAIYLW